MTDRLDLDAEAFVESRVRADRPARTLLALLAPRRRALLGAVAAFLIKDSPIWALPPITAAIIDVVVTRGSVSSVAVWGAVALVLLAANYPFHMTVVRLTSSAFRALALTLRTALAARLQRLSFGFHNRQSASIVQTKIVRDVENLELMLQQAFPTLLSALATLVGAIVVTATRVPEFVVVFAIAIPVAATLVVAIRKRATARNDAFRSEVERLSAQVAEMASLLPVTRGHGLEDVATRSVTERADAVRRAGRELDVLNGRFGALSWISYQVLGLLCLVGAASAQITGLLPMTPGEVVLLSTYFTILTNAIVMLLGVMPVYTRGLDAVRSIGALMRELDIENDAGKPAIPRFSGRVTLEAATVRFPGDEQPALDGVDLDIAAGETVAFVGASGSGKSTLLNVVLGFVAPTSGRVLVDGVDLATLDRRSFRRFVSIVPQQVVLLAGSIRDNVTYGLRDVPDDRVRTALESAHALTLVDGMTEGLDARLAPGGAPLSGGQRQRLAIARALVREPRLLVLDEATSALDPVSEAGVALAIDAARQGRTTLIVAHRLATVRRADRIVVLDEGRVVEVGSFDDLVAAGGAFARLERASRAAD